MRGAFLDGAHLTERWRGRDRFVILETRFGSGLNFLAAWQALRDDPHGPTRLHFVAVEAQPLTATALRLALGRFADETPGSGIGALASALVAAWPPPMPGFHRLIFDGGRVTLTLLLGDADAMLSQIDVQADVICVDGQLRDGEVGTQVIAGSRHAAVIGAGVAGSLCAERLAVRGWTVTVIDAHPAQSAAPAGLLRPVLNLRDTVNAQVSRPAFLYALQYLRSLQRDGYHPMWFPSGILQLANDKTEAQRMSAIATAQPWPADLLRFVDANEAAEMAGRAVRGAGWWIAGGAWVSPTSLCNAALARGGDRIRVLRGRGVGALTRETGTWQVRDGPGTVLTEASVVVVANAHGATRLVPEARLGLSPVRGQVTVLPPDPRRRLAIGVSGNGYVAPTPEGGHVIGASFDHDDESVGLRDADHAANLVRAESMLPGFGAGTGTAALGGWAGVRATVRDRLPIAGQGAMPGLWFLTGLGSRGLLWAPIAAELIASDLDGDPQPLPRSLAGALSPNRFLSWPR